MIPMDFGMFLRVKETGSMIVLNHEYKIRDAIRAYTDKFGA
jgi:hypothetical protein